MEIILLKLLFNYNIYNKYIKYIDLSFIKDNSNKYINNIIKVIQRYHEKYPNKGISSADELALHYFASYSDSSEKDRQAVEPIFTKIQNTTVTEESAEEYLSSLKQRTMAGRMALLALSVSEGQKDFKELIEYSKTLEEGVKIEEDYKFVIDESEEGRPPTGIRWPLKCLNEMMGSLRKGNFGFVFARPETGKTTFVAQFCSHASKQLEEGCILWFNNEQPGIEVLHRCIQSYFGITSSELYKNKKEYLTRYREETKGRIKIVDDAFIDKRLVERLCEQYSPKAIIFDQIDKIKGFQSDRQDLELKEIYRWARELSKKYGPTMGVCQAGGTAEGKKWLTMDDVDSSKTAKQGEADWILGIGKSHQEGMEAIRHFHICKNKLQGDEDTRPELRHGKCDVILRQEIARYEDIKL